MVSIIEKPKKPVALKKADKNGNVHVNEAPKLYIVSVNNNPKKELDNKPQQDIEIGLPPQPKEYLKYPEYDWL